MRLTVLNVSYPLAPVSAGTPGGAEQVLATIDEALVRAGHRSLVIAPEGSHCEGLLLPTSSVGSVLDEEAKQNARQEHRTALRRALQRFSVDVVHLHGLDFVHYLPETGVPTVVTLHLPPSWYPAEAFVPRSGTYQVCVSESQARACPPEAPIEAVIANGVRVDRFKPGKKKSSYVLSLGRICPEKAFHLAMDAAEAAGVPLWLAGTAFGYPAHQAYFEREIEPRLRAGHRFMGPIGGRRKAALLAGAKCLLIPSQAPETSSLVVMEAMACGTPVVAFRSGALCDLIEHGRTGFLVETLEELTNAIPATAGLDSQACRTMAEMHFSAQRMTDRYLALYEKVAAQKTSASSDAPASQAVCCL